MPPKTRLDVVVNIREREEERARKELAEAQKTAMDAESALLAAIEHAKRDERRRGRSQDWDIIEIAHGRALVEQRQAEKVAKAANDQVGSSRDQFMDAYARAEAMRRVVETRRAEILKEADTAERKELDEIGTMLFIRR